MGRFSFIIVLTMAAYDAVVNLGYVVYAQIRIFGETNYTLTHLFIVQMPDGLRPHFLVLATEQDLCVAKPMQDIDGGRFVELGGSGEKKRVAANHFLVDQILYQRAFSMNGGCFPFAVEYLYLFGTFPVHTAVKPFGMYGFWVYLKAVTVDVFTDGEGGLHRGRLMDGGNVQAEVLHVYAFASLAVLERIHDETLVKSDGLQHIRFS